MQRFYLSDNFLEKYKEVTPNWGPLGEFTYLRTYSRVVDGENRNEAWWETVKRVVEGCFNIQKEHCAKLRLPWINSKAQRSAQIMYDKMFNFKFLAAGRSLWMQGTKYIEERTPMGLFNCAAVTSEDIATRGSFPFVWAMDLLMLGCIAKGEKIFTAEGPKNIEDLENHPFVAIVNGKPYFSRTGSWKIGRKDVFSLKTKEGYELKLTDNHKILTEDNKWKEVKDLNIGDKLVINNSQNIKWRGKGTFYDGYLLGVFWGDGYYSRDPILCVYDKDIGSGGIIEQSLICLENIISQKALRKDHAGFRKRESKQIQELSIGTWATDFISKGKVLDDRVEMTSYDFHCGFLRGAFDADGCVVNSDKCKVIKLTQTNYNNLQVIQRMLLRLGIKSKIYKKRDASKTLIQGREVNQKECFELVVSRKSIKIFYEHINFSHKIKREKLANLPTHDFYNEKFIVEISSINYIGISDVYDINIEEIASFDANGFVVHNCGVGFDVRGAGKITIKQPKNSEGSLNYIIPDSREGWVEALGLLLDSFFYGKKLPIFDYSEIRPYGASIKGFGGTASGPGPLKEMFDNIKNLMEDRIGEELRSTDIVDIMNFIAVCVVAGNTRRSALLALGEPTDKEYVTMKDSNKYAKKLKESRWASNNSVFAEAGKTDYSKFTENIALNGEPGLIWLENLRKYGRLKDGATWADKEIVTTNPCQPGWAKVLAKKGIIKLSEVNIGDEIWSKEGWTVVTNKFSNGIKKVFKYETTAGRFYGTKNHKIISNGKKIEIDKSETIEILRGNFDTNLIIDAQDIMDGLIIGDGSIHKVSNNLIYLCIGENDESYFNSEIKHLIKEQRKGIHECAYEIETTIKPEELSLTFNRKIPERFIKNKNKIIGFLRGLYSANGSVCNNRITLKTSSRNIVEDVQLMLSSLGIKSYYTTNKQSKVKFNNGKYVCKESFDINITIDREKFVSLIGFIQEYKNQKIKIIDSNERKIDYDIIEKQFLSEEEVFDITVDNKSHTYWTEGCNVSNCGEIGLPSASLCNLVETFPSNHDSYEEFKETLKYAYLYGKSMTLVSTHWPETNQMIMKNRRIGVSQSGIIDAFIKHGRREILNWCDFGYEYLRELDEIYSNWLCIPKSIKITTTKPSGSVSLLPGVSPGIHYPHSEYYIRRVRVSSLSSLVEPMKKAGYNIVPEIYGSEETKKNTVVVEFPVHEEYFYRKKEDVTLWEQIKNVADYQWYWADNAVSNTLTFKEEEVKDIPRVLEAYEDQLKSVSFLPIKEHGYDLAPYQSITKEEYKKMIKKLKKPDFSHITSEPVGEKYCSNDSCEIIGK